MAKGDGRVNEGSSLSPHPRRRAGVAGFPGQQERDGPLSSPAAGRRLTAHRRQVTYTLTCLCLIKGASRPCIPERLLRLMYFFFFTLFFLLLPLCSWFSSFPPFVLSLMARLDLMSSLLLFSVSFVLLLVFCHFFPSYIHSLFFFLALPLLFLRSFFFFILFVSLLFPVFLLLPLSQYSSCLLMCFLLLFFVLLGSKRHSLSLFSFIRLLDPRSFPSL